MSDCEIAQYYKCQERTAQKSHGCCECDAPIHPGEKYLQVNACWEHPETYRQHILCQHACEFVRDAGLNDDECLYYGGLKEWYSEHVKGGYILDNDLGERLTIWRFMLKIRRRERLAKQR